MLPTEIAGPVRAPAPLRAALHPLHLWHLLSLDAPTIATLWTAFLARLAGVTLPRATLLAMALSVWTLYAADRLLDARPLLRHTLPAGLEARHLFHHRHRPAFLLALVPVTVVLGLLLPRLAPSALRLDLLLGAMLIGYFVLIHATASAARLPKEIAVGLFFSAACFVPTVARRPDLRLTLLPPALLFAGLCSLNCLTIFAMEHPSSSSATTTAHPVTRFAVNHLGTFSLFLLAASLGLAFAGPALIRPAAVAVALSTLGLLWTRHLPAHQPHGPLSDAVTLRALADLALATPVLLWPWLPPR